MADDPRATDPRAEIWALGLLGVNVVESPLHLVDGELISGQNAEPFTEEGEGGLRKRLGIGLFTPDDLGSGIVAITSIPLPDPQDDALGGPGDADPDAFGLTPVPGQTGVLEILVDDNPPTTRASANGTTWSSKSIAALAEGFHNGGPPKSYFYNGRCYYVAEASGATLGQIRAYDGFTDVLEGTLPSTHPLNGATLDNVVGLAGVGDQLFVVAIYNTPTYLQVMTATIGSGSFTAFCEGLKTTAGVEAGFILRTSLVNGICAFDGSVYIAGYEAGATTGYLYRAAPGASAWTADQTFASRFVVAIGQAGTSLFFTTRAAGGADFQLERRDVGGSLTVVRGPQAAQIGAMGVHLQRVYIQESSNLFRSTDNGGSFTQIATGTIGSSVGALGKLTKLGSTYYLFLNTEFLRDDGAGVTEITVGGGSFLSGLMRF